MAIIIQNISGDDASPSGVNHYQLRINQQVICEFEHDRSKGLARCLRDAAREVGSTPPYKLKDLEYLEVLTHVFQ